MDKPEVNRWAESLRILGDAIIISREDMSAHEAAIRKKALEEAITVGPKKGRDLLAAVRGAIPPDATKRDLAFFNSGFEAALDGCEREIRALADKEPE